MSSNEPPEDKVVRLMRDAAQKGGSAGQKADESGHSSVVNISGNVAGDLNLVIIQTGCGRPAGPTPL